MTRLLPAGIRYLRAQERVGPCRVLLADLCGYTRPRIRWTHSQLDRLLRATDFWLSEYGRALDPGRGRERALRWLESLDENKE